MKTLNLVTAAAALLVPMAVHAAPVSILSMNVSGTVRDIDLGSGLIETDTGGLVSFSQDKSLPLSYYGLSGGFFTTEIGGAVNGVITLFEDSETSEVSLSCALAQYSWDSCAGAAWAWNWTDAEDNLVLGAGDGGYYTEIITNGITASMLYADDNQYGGITSDGLFWHSFNLTMRWDLTIEPTILANEELVTTPLPSTGLLLLTPLALVAWRRR